MIIPFAQIMGRPKIFHEKASTKTLIDTNRLFLGGFLKQESTHVSCFLLEMKQMSPDGKLPKGALLEARPTIEFASQQYALVKGLDAQNEKRPRRNQ